MAKVAPAHLFTVPCPHSLCPRQVLKEAEYCPAVWHVHMPPPLRGPGCLLVFTRLPPPLEAGGLLLSQEPSSPTSKQKPVSFRLSWAASCCTCFCLPCQGNSQALCGTHHSVMGTTFFLQNGWPPTLISSHMSYDSGMCPDGNIVGDKFSK